MIAFVVLCMGVRAFQSSGTQTEQRIQLFCHYYVTINSKTSDISAQLRTPTHHLENITLKRQMQGLEGHEQKYNALLCVELLAVAYLT